MPVLEANDGTPVLFMHIPKTGGTTIELCFKGRKILYTGSTRKTCFSVNAQHFDAGTVRALGLTYLISSSFAIVRDPYTRIVSEFNHYHKSRYFKLSFMAFIFLAYFRLKHDRFVYDNHLRPQTDFLLDNTMIYYLEDGLEGVIENVSRAFNLRAVSSVQPYNASQASSEVTLDDFSINLINRMYEEDFNRLKFKRRQANASLLYISALYLVSSIELTLKLSLEILVRNVFKNRRI